LFVCLFFWVFLFAVTLTVVVVMVVVSVFFFLVFVVMAAALSVVHSCLPCPGGHLFLDFTPSIISTTSPSPPPSFLPSFLHSY
jgi:hypothetical protein